MTDTAIDDSILRDSLSTATCFEDVYCVILAADSDRFFQANAKEPFVRKAVLLLATPADEEDAATFARRVSCLAFLWSVKGVKGIVDELSKRILSRPFPELTLLLKPKEREVIAKWLSEKTSTWIQEFAAHSALLEIHNEHACSTYVKTVFLRSKTVSEGLTVLLNAYEKTVVEKEIILDEQSRHHFIMLITKTAAKAKSAPGPALGKALGDLLKVLAGESWEHSDSRRLAELAFAAFDVIEEGSRRSPNILISGSTFILLQHLERHWVPQNDRKWIKRKAAMVPVIENILVSAVIHGAQCPQLIEIISFLDEAKGAAQRVSRAILDQWNVTSESAHDWLQSMADGRFPRPQVQSRSDVESLATVLLRAYEFEHTENESSNNLAQALLAEIRQLSLRHGLALDHEKGEAVTFDPVRQRSVSEKNDESVRVLVPGVVRQVEGGKTVQIIPALVGPL